MDSHPTDPAKLFHFRRSNYLMKLDFIEKYGASDRLREIVYYQFYVSQFQNGYKACMKNDCLEGYYWLLQKYPKRFKRPKHR